MAEHKPKLFRQEALEQLASPERLDFLVQLVRPKDWILLATFGGLLAVGLGWSIFGQVPVEVEGEGILIQPDAVVPLNASMNGQIKTLYIKPHQCVRKGHLLATLDPIELKEQLQLQRSKQAQLQAQAQDFHRVQDQRIASEQMEIAASRTQLTERLYSTQTMSPALETKNIDAIRQQRVNLKQRLKDAQAMAPVLREYLQKRQELADTGAISKGNLIQAQQEYDRTLQLITETQAQLKQTEVTEAENQQKYAQNLNTMSEIQTQLQQLETRSQRLAQEKLESRNSQLNQIQEVNREITKLEAEINRSSQIHSLFDGCILEFTATPGQIVARGASLGRINVDGKPDQTVVMAYFSPGIRLSSYYDKKVFVIPSSATPGDGAIIGKLTSASLLPVTQQGIATNLGNSEIVPTIVGQMGGKMEARIEMERDISTPSGYRWTSGKGADIKLTPGASVHVKIRLKERAPITMLVPMLEKIFYSVFQASAAQISHGTVEYQASKQHRQMKNAVSILNHSI